MTINTLFGKIERNLQSLIGKRFGSVIVCKDHASGDCSIIFRNTGEEDIVFASPISDCSIWIDAVTGGIGNYSNTIKKVKIKLIEDRDRTRGVLRVEGNIDSFEVHFTLSYYGD